MADPGTCSQRYEHAPSDTIDETYLRGPVSVQTLASRRELFNAVSGTYTSPGKQYQPTNFTALS